jgi:vacuolar-type H+-ATPase subunit H
VSRSACWFADATRGWTNRRRALAASRCRQTEGVATVRGILDRLRPAGAPGAAGKAAVPADRRESLAGELAPVFADLEPVLSECTRITEEATAAAQRREAEAAGHAHDIVANAQTESESERAGIVAAARSEANRETERSHAQAREQAQHVRQRGDQRRPQLLARVLDLVRADLRALADDSGAGP